MQFLNKLFFRKLTVVSKTTKGIVLKLSRKELMISSFRRETFFYQKHPIKKQFLTNLSLITKIYKYDFRKDVV